MKGPLFYKQHLPHFPYYKNTPHFISCLTGLCRGEVLGIRFVADMLWTCLEISRIRYDSRNRTNGVSV